MSKVPGEIAKGNSMVPEKSCCTHKCRVGLTPEADREQVVTADRSAAIETHAGAGIGRPTTIVARRLRTNLAFARELICIARSHHEVKEPGVPTGVTATERDRFYVSASRIFFSAIRPT